LSGERNASGYQGVYCIASFGMLRQHTLNVRLSNYLQIADIRFQRINKSEENYSAQKTD